jgi:hypothetical protein
VSEHDDQHARALDAYAASTSGEALNSVQLRRQILNDVTAPQRRASRKLSFVLALAATFAASAAFAATQPAVREAVYRGVQALFGVGPVPAASSNRPGSARQAAAPPAPSSAPPLPAEPSPPTLSPDDLPLVPRASAAPSLARPAASTAPPAPAASGSATFDAQVESYRQAHRQHFGGAAPAAALAAWDDYLRAYPDGSFATDARFNRALCLLRLGRRDEARAALRPFAEAPIGSYRQQEAASLLLSLERGAK